MKLAALMLTITWTGLWLTPDQQGQRLMNRKEFSQAAQTFDDPMRQGVAWYRAGEFEKAAQAFARVSTAEGSYNQGNAWLMRGKYDQAIKCYDRALKLRPGWTEANENRTLAAARAKRLQAPGGDLGDQQEGADEIVFDKNTKQDGQDTEVAGGGEMSDNAIQAIWLRQVQTKPADFLKAKFAYQQAQQAEGAEK